MEAKSRLYILILLITTLTCNGQNNLMLGAGTGNILSDKQTGFLFLGTTIVVSAINTSNTYFNIIKLHKYDKYRSNAIFGALAGALQTTFGIANATTTYKGKDIITGVNIGFGLTTVATSIIRLATKNPPKENKVTFNLYYLPTVGHYCNATVGFRVIGRLN